MGRAGDLFWRRHLRREVQFVLDLGALGSAFVLAYLLRFEFQVPPSYVHNGLLQLPLVVLFQFSLLVAMGVYSFVWRYVGMTELKTFVASGVLSATPLLLLRLVLPDELAAWRIPLSVILMDSVLGFGGVLALRVLRRALYERFEKPEGGAEVHGKPKPVLLIGAGHAGLLAVSEIRRRKGVGLEVKGFVDDDSAKQGAVIHGVKVLGSTRDLPRLVRDMGIDHIVITMARASRKDIRRIVEVCDGIPVKARIIPTLQEILGDETQVSRIRDVDVRDLLGREPVLLDEDELRRFLAGKTVMVTGAGGSIGSELARQVAGFHPSNLLLVERAEFALFEIARTVDNLALDLDVTPLVGDVGDRSRMQSILSKYRPQVLLHAAAHKHVPMMESNTSEAIKNNVFGTKLLGELAGEFGAEVFVLISTDKAVNPTSIMGASKRIAELVVQHLNSKLPPRYVAVRFGNVMDSKGSVMQIFREQIARGGPVTVTEPDMMRYFMTIPEAAQLVLQAGAMGNGGEIFILDMGQPVRIVDLARDMITLSGLKPFEDIDIVFSGARPGEKRFEELEIFGEQIAKTHHPKIFIGKLAPYSTADLEQGLARLAEMSECGRDDEIRSFLNTLLPEARIGPAQPTQSKHRAAEAVHRRAFQAFDYTRASPREPTQAEAAE